MDRRVEVEQLRRSIAMLSPGARDAVGREDALRLLTELHDAQDRTDEPWKRRPGGRATERIQRVFARKDDRPATAVP
jgi:hypothetical protein